MLPSNHDEAAALAARIRLRGPQDAVVGVLAHVRLLTVPLFLLLVLFCSSFAVIGGAVDVLLLLLLLFLLLFC